MTQPWPDSENVDGEPVDVLGIDGPFQGGQPEDDGSAGVRDPLRPHDAPPSLAAEAEPDRE